MSYNIDTVRVIVNSGATMKVADIFHLHCREEEFPSRCFIRQMAANYERLLYGSAGTHQPITDFHWHGEGSGTSWDGLKEEVAAAISGELLAVFVWEGGDSVTLVHIKDGVLTECNLYDVLKDPAVAGAMAAVLAAAPSPRAA